MFYTVGEMAYKLNVAPSTLRYYDKEGLLPFVERSSGSIRMFKHDTLPEEDIPAKFRAAKEKTLTLN